MMTYNTIGLRRFHANQYTPYFKFSIAMSYHTTINVIFFLIFIYSTNKIPKTKHVISRNIYYFIQDYSILEFFLLNIEEISINDYSYFLLEIVLVQGKLNKSMYNYRKSNDKLEPNYKKNQLILGNWKTSNLIENKNWQQWIK